MTLRPPLGVLNELSVPSGTDDSLEAEDALDVLAELVATLRAAREIRPDLALATQQPLGSIPITPTGDTFAGLASQAGGINRDRWRYIQTLRSRSPLSSVSELRPVDLDECYRYGDHDCEGLALAAASRQLAVSLLTDKRWDCHAIELEHIHLIETDDGGIIEQVDGATVPHVCRQEHVHTLRDTITDLALPSPFTGADLWVDRSNRYPHLYLLNRVEAQLNAIGPGSKALRQIDIHLQKLNTAVGVWDPAVQTFPAWHSKVSPESKTRKHLWRLVDDDGVTRIFDLHDRFTPNEGRIHFCLVPENPEGRLRIAYIGPKRLS